MHFHMLLMYTSHMLDCIYFVGVIIHMIVICKYVLTNVYMNIGCKKIFSRKSKCQVFHFFIKWLMFGIN